MTDKSARQKTYPAGGQMKQVSTKPIRFAGPSTDGNDKTSDNMIGFSIEQILQKVRKMRKFGKICRPWADGRGSWKSRIIGNVVAHPR
jgi:hypothetical protein